MTTLYPTSSPDFHWLAHPEDPRNDSAIENQWSKYFNTDLFEDEAGSTNTTATTESCEQAPEPAPIYELPAEPLIRSSNLPSPQQQQLIPQATISPSPKPSAQNPLRPKRRAVSRPTPTSGVSQSPICKKRYSKSTSPSLHLQDYIYRGAIPHMVAQAQPQWCPPASVRAHAIPSIQTSIASAANLLHPSLRPHSPSSYPIMRRLSVETRYAYPSPQTPYPAVAHLEQQVSHTSTTAAQPLFRTAPYLASPPTSSSPAYAPAPSPELADRPLFSPSSDPDSLRAFDLGSPTPYALGLVPVEQHAVLPYLQATSSPAMAPAPVPQAPIVTKLSAPPKRGVGRPRKVPKVVESPPRSPKDITKTGSHKHTASSSSSAASSATGRKTPKSPSSRDSTFAGISKAAHPGTPKTPRKTGSGSASPPAKKSGRTGSSECSGLAFVNYTTHDKRKLLAGVAPSGSSKTKAKREKEAAEQKEKEIVEMMMQASATTRREERARFEMEGVVGMGMGMEMGRGRGVVVKMEGAEGLRGPDVMWGM